MCSVSDTACAVNQGMQGSSEQSQTTLLISGPKKRDEE